jgi:hypothetical protein
MSKGADMRFREGLAEWEQALASAPWQIQSVRDISAEVVRGMERNSERSLDLVARCLPKFMRGLGRDFAGTKGSRLHNALVSGEMVYRRYSFVKIGDRS